ncbi:MAG TPA: glycerol kinase [Desulfobacterales bacterium]|nr:glycerol kinase [Desulfobacterales bacterium]HIP40022.1 glycerol kinase [Desulfocapsa sulfexigens]
MSILAIDQGTTSTRALVIENSGQSRIVKSLEHNQFYPRPGWVEHDAEQLINNIRICINSCDDLEAIGIDNQGESCLAWHADTKEAITPVIVWQDNRTQAYIDMLKAENNQELVLSRAGLPLDSYFSAAKFSWILQNIPDAKMLLQRGKLRLGTTDAFFLDRLTGRFVTDISTASRTSLMNLQSGKWDTDLCDLFGVPCEALPEIVSTCGCFGEIAVGGKSVPVTASVVDQQAALYGHGCRKTGDAKITFGTGAFVLVVTGDKPYQAAEQGLLPTVAWQLKGENPVYALDGGVFSAGSAINWAKSLGLFSDYKQIQEFTNHTNSAIERDLAFVPALSGLGCPYWDRKAGGVWIGLSLDTHPMDLMQSILEGIAFRAAEVVAAMNEFVSIQGEISIDGGLSANHYFCQFLADVLNLQVVVQASSELTAIGTARLAAGNKSIKISDENCIQRYEPEKDMGQHLLKFKDAVSRSSNWRS